MLGYYGKRRLMFMRLADMCKPRWMKEIDDKHKLICKSIRRHCEKVRLT